MASDTRAAKAIKLLDKLTELEDDFAEKRAALHAELATVLGGGEGIGSRLTRLKAFWCIVWQERHKEKIEFDHVAHTAGLKKKALTRSNAEIETKMANFVATDEAYYVRARHPFGLFLKTFDQWRGLSVDVNGDTSAHDTSEKLRGLRGE